MTPAAGVKNSSAVVAAKKSFASILTPPDGITMAVAAVSAYFISLPQSYKLLVYVMVCTGISGTSVALLKALRSREGLDSLHPWEAVFEIVRRVLEFSLLPLTHSVFDVLGNHVGRPIDITPLLAMALVGIEFLSFTKDCKYLGVPLPNFYIKRLEQLQKWVDADAAESLIIPVTDISPREESPPGGRVLPPKPS